MITRMLSSFALLAALAVLAGCAGGEPDTPAGGGQANAANDADIAFATQMIPHHAQAIEMAELVASRGESEQVADLARQIEAAQDPEIETMTGWLREWGAPVPGSDGGHGGHGDMPGMMSGADLTGLRHASGAAFDRMWLTMMIKHHEGAIAMARTELRDGEHPGARTMAQEIIDGQQAEIDEMKSLLARG